MRLSSRARRDARRSDDEALAAVLDRISLPADHPSSDLASFLSVVVSAYGNEAVPEPNPTLASVLEHGSGTPNREELALGTARSELDVGTRRSRIAFRPAFAGVAVMVSLALLGGLAAAGALPGPIQRTLADVASDLGIELPGGTPTTKPGDNTTSPSGGRTGEPGAGTPSRPVRPSPRGTPATSLPQGSGTGNPSTPGATTPSSGATLPAPTVPTVPPATVPTLPPATVPTLPPATVLTLPSLKRS